MRTELLFLQNQTHAPSEDEQLRQYQGIVNAMHGRPVTLRTLDIGGDKPAPYLTLLRAMLRVQPAGQVRIMIPMVGFVSEAQACRHLIEQEKQALGIQAKVETGIMVEVPSAALLAEQFAQTAVFFLEEPEEEQETSYFALSVKILSLVASNIAFVPPMNMRTYVRIYK